MFCKIIFVTENKFSRLFFFSGRDKKIAGQIVAALNAAKDSRQIDFAVSELINKSQSWLVNGIQRFNLHKIIYLTLLCYAFAFSNSSKQRELIAENVNHFIAETNTRGLLEINMALLRAPCRIIAAYQNKNTRRLIEAVNDYRQILEQPPYAKSLLELEGSTLPKNKFRVINQDSLAVMLTAQNVAGPGAAEMPKIKNNPKPQTAFHRISRIYRNLKPLIRNSYRVLAGVSTAALCFTLFPNLDFPLPNVILFNTLLNLFTNSVMLCISARGTKFWQYRLSDINPLKLSQSVMYSSLGLPLTQFTAYALQNILAGANNLVLANAATLLGVGLAGAGYTFINNKARGKNSLETKLNTLRPVFGSASAAGLAAAAGGLPQNYLTLLSMLMGNVYRLIVEGTINYSLYKRFIYKNLKQLELENGAEEKLIKFNIEAMSFIENPGGAASVQSYLNALAPLELVRLFGKLGQDRSLHLADIQNFSYVDSARAEYYFTNTYFEYRKMLALAVRTAGHIKQADSLENIEAADNAVNNLLLRIKNLPAAQIKVIREETVNRTFSGLSEMSAAQINDAVLALCLKIKRCRIFKTIWTIYLKNRSVRLWRKFYSENIRRFIIRPRENFLPFMPGLCSVKPGVNILNTLFIKACYKKIGGDIMLAKIILTGEKNEVWATVDALLKEVEETKPQSKRLMKPQNIFSDDPVVIRFRKDLKEQQTLSLNDLFDQLKKIITSPEARSLINNYLPAAGTVSFPKKYYFNNELLSGAKALLAAAGVQQAADIPQFLLRAGVSAEHSYFAGLKQFVENIILGQTIDLAHWLSAKNTFLLLTILIKGTNKYTVPFDLAETRRQSAFYFFSAIQDILIGSFTNLAEITLENYAGGGLHKAATAIFKLSFKDKSLKSYEKLLALLLIIGRISRPGDKINIYCPDNDRNALLNGLNFYISCSAGGKETALPYTEAIRIIENYYVYVQKLIAELDSGKNSPAAADFQEITPLLSKALIYLNSAREIETKYFPNAGTVLSLAGTEIILPFILGPEPGRKVFGLYGEYQHSQENIKIRTGFNRALQAAGVLPPDFSIALDYQRLSPAEQNYFSQINLTPLEEIHVLSAAGYAVRLIERINSPVTKADFIEKTIELLYVNYNTLSEFEKNLFEDRLVLAAYNTSATDKVKIACQNTLKRLADSGKISARNYKSWLSQAVSYRGLELYADELIKELKIFQKRRRSYDMIEFLTELLLRFLPLTQKIKSSSRPVKMLNKLWRLEKQFIKERNLSGTERLLAELITVLTNLRQWFHKEANLAEEVFYKPLWEKAPSENPLFARLRPFFIDLRNVARNIYRHRTDNWDLFIQFMHELDAARQQGLKYENLIPARELIASFLGEVNYAKLLPLIDQEMHNEIKKFLPAGQSAYGFDQAWYYQGNGSASAFTIGSILAYAQNNGITLSALAEDLSKEFGAVLGSIPGLSKTSIENKLLRCSNPDSGVSVNAGIEKILIAIIKKRTQNLYCAYEIGLCCDSAAVTGQAIYNLIKRVGSESAIKMIEGTAAKFHDHKKVNNIAVGSLLSPENELYTINLLEFNAKGQNYDLLAALDILLWT
ncbi:hypothetical protein NO1_1891, partial [Candidatus Termititenax aidoneus]